MTPVPSWQSLLMLVVIAAASHFVARRIWQHRPVPAAALTPLLPWIAGACVVAFAILTAALLVGGLLPGVDAQVRTAVQTLQDDAFVRLCLFVTSMGDFEALVGITIVAAGLLWAHGRRQEVAGLTVSVLGSQATTYLFKYAIGRERPAFESFASAMTPSFPSGHAAGAVAVFGFMVFAIARRLPPRARFETTFWGTAFIVLLAATRIMLGVHYLSDVVAGLLVGAFWLIAGCATATHRNIIDLKPK